ncbi:hypothetical protein FSARC_6580 [Fusarium sarcochroum]|uniref:Zn(2)-C6 fungal-type domain-containing protein n=1 Tax=Fusarium sarcochroum TaxID=1208366 RepID=A0A8H4X885_9HYPO|nr:hypothetical protein FSARC_6580 [Fusarium sarcochroum]
MIPDSFRALNELSTPHAARSAKPVRLRLACDACTTAKVRCSKTHPCERCEDNGQERECSYSASRRHGKRARHRKMASETQRPSSSSDTATPAALTTPGYDFASMHYSSEFAWEDYNSNTPEYPASNLDNNHEILDNWAFHNIDLILDFDLSWEPFGSISDASPSHSSGMISPQISLSTDPTLSLETTTPASSISTPNSMQVPKQSHDCEAMALKVLRSLHCNSSTDQDANTFQQPYDLTSSLVVSRKTCVVPSIDTVLFANKTALTDLIPLLKCTCARNPHIAMLHSAIFSKVIFWYRIAVATRYQTEGVELRPMKIQLGMLDLDEDDQATLQRTVLLRELRKAEKVMESFDFCVSGEEEVPSWQASAVQNMREELQAIIQKIKKGQGELA